VSRKGGSARRANEGRTHLFGGGDGGELPKQHAAAHVWDQPPFGLHDAEPAGGCGKAKVAPEGDLQAASEAHAVDTRDHGHGEGPPQPGHTLRQVRHGPLGPPQQLRLNRRGRIKPYSGRDFAPSRQGRPTMLIGFAATDLTSRPAQNASPRPAKITARIEVSCWSLRAVSRSARNIAMSIFGGIARR
jgi:hypothetical protein